MARLRLHLDAEASSRALHAALLARGHDVTRTPNEWIASDAADGEQLLLATAQGRCVSTFNVRDYVVLVRRFPRHGGVVLAAQANWRLAELIAALDRLLTEAQAEEWIGRVGWLNDWRDTGGAGPTGR